MRNDRYCVRIEIHDNKTDKFIVNEGFNANSLISVIEELEIILKKIKSIEFNQ